MFGPIADLFTFGVAELRKQNHGGSGGNIISQRLGVRSEITRVPSDLKGSLRLSRIMVPLPISLRKTEHRCHRPNWT